MDILFKTNHIRQQLMVLLMLAMLSFPLSAQTGVPDSLFMFRFSAMGLNEECFLTRTHVAQSMAAEVPETPSSQADMNATEPYRPSNFMSVVTLGDRVVLKTNLLYYAILMPNIEAEWMFKDRWSAALEFQGAWYAKNNPHKVYRIATIIPEARYWLIDRSRWHGMYVGAFVGIGKYDLDNGKPNHNGHKGEGAMAGVSAGYMWPIGKHFSLDASLGVGYLYARDKEYLPADGHFLYQLSKNINYFGPLRLKLSLVWHFQSKKSNGKK